MHARMFAIPPSRARLRRAVSKEPYAIHNKPALPGTWQAAFAISTALSLTVLLQILAFKKPAGKGKQD